MKQQSNSCLELDGSEGEGGGQVLRTALSLSMITGTPFRIDGIRGKRSKPGLLRQHLTAVQAAAAISGAEVQGAVLGSQTLSFTPGTIRGGNYRFAIGTAGSCTLVLQTVLPALWFADAPSSVIVSGGTHNRAAPPADFLIRCWQPLLLRMGVQQSISVQRHGFYPAGGGEMAATIMPVVAWQALSLLERGDKVSVRAEALVAGLADSVARRELERVAAQMADVTGIVRELPSREGPGNVLMLEVVHAGLVELFTGFGEKGVSAEAVADAAAKEARHYLNSAAAVGEHLADQLLLPMALAGGGMFTAVMASSHLHTNKQVIEKFLPVEIRTQETEAGTVRIEVV